jgi:hypothetical protein
MGFRLSYRGSLHTRLPRQTDGEFCEYTVLVALRQNPHWYKYSIICSEKNTDCIFFDLLTTPQDGGINELGL